MVGLFIWALVAFESHEGTIEARSKAAELAAAYEQEGLGYPSEDLIVRTSDSYGGNLCRNADNALNQAVLNRQLSNGAAYAGVRPTIVDRQVPKGQELRVDIYCPDELPGFRNYV